MSTHTKTGATGEGHEDLFTGGPSEQVIQLTMSVTSVTSPKVRVLGSDSPRGLRYAGSYGLLQSGYISNCKHIQFEKEIIQLTGYVAVSAQQLWWKLAPGVTVNFTVSW